MQEEKTAENKANYIDGGNFKARIGNTTYLESNIYKVAGNCYEETRYEKSSLQRCRTDSVRIRTSKSNTDLR